MRGAIIACVLAAAGGLAAADAARAEPAGDLWEVVSQPSIAGMPFRMPAKTSRVCAAHQWTRPPPVQGPDPTCAASDFNMSGSTVTWRIACQNPPATGVGEITRGDGSYTGTIQFSTANGDMTIALTGTRVGTCDNPQ